MIAVYSFEHSMPGPSAVEQRESIIEVAKTKHGTLQRERENNNNSPRARYGSSEPKQKRHEESVFSDVRCCVTALYKHQCVLKIAVFYVIHASIQTSSECRFLSPHQQSQRGPKENISFLLSAPNSDQIVVYLLSLT